MNLNVKKQLLKVLSDSDKKEILSKGTSFLIIRIVGLFAAYIFALIVTRFYGATVYGLLSLSFAIFILSGVLGRLGLDVNLVRFFGSENNWKERGLFYKVLLKTIFVSGTLGTLIYLFRHFICLHLFSKPELAPFLFWISITLPFWSIAMLSGGMFRALKRSNWFAFLGNSGRFLFSVIFLLFFWLYFNEPLDAIKAHFFAITTLSLFGLISLIFTLEKISFKSRVNSWRFLKDAIPMMLSSTILVLLGWMDTLVLGIYVDTSEVGIYNISLKIATLASFSLQAINAILAPKLANVFAQGKMLQFNRLVRFTTKLNFFLTAGIVACIIIFHAFILKLFGEAFIAGSSILIVLSTGQFINSISGSVGVILQMTGNQKMYQNYVLLALGLNLLLNFLLTPRIGALGAAIATTVSILSWNLLGARYLKVNLNIVSYFSIRA